MDFWCLVDFLVGDSLDSSGKCFLLRRHKPMIPLDPFLGKAHGLPSGFLDEVFLLELGQTARFYRVFFVFVRR